MDRRGEIPFYAWESGRRYYARHYSTLTRKNRTSSSHNLHQDQGPPWRPPERTSRHPTVKKRINLQVSQQQLKIHTGSTAFLMREDSSRDLLGKFHKDRSVWIRARRRVLQCLSYQFPCALQLKQWGILHEVDSAKNITKQETFQNPRIRSRA